MRAEILKSFFGKDVKVVDFRFFIGMVETQESSRRKGGYIGYTSYYEFGKFLIYDNEIWKVGFIEIKKVVSKKKRNFKTYWKQVSLANI